MTDKRDVTDGSDTSETRGEVPRGSSRAKHDQVGGDGTSEADGGVEPPRGVNGSGRGAAVEVFYCDLCGSVMLNLHCKLICEQCGYKRDCSDP